MKLDYFYITVQSNLLEIPVYYLFYRGFSSWRKTALVTTFSNAITHPLVFFAFMGFGISYFTSVLLAEAFAVVGESLLHRKPIRADLSQTLVAAFFANLFSWQIAPILTYLFFF